jgi:hypothetical protein
VIAKGSKLLRNSAADTSLFSLSESIGIFIFSSIFLKVYLHHPALEQQLSIHDPTATLEHTVESQQPLKVLIHLHPQLDTLDFTGPLDILPHATWPPTISFDEPISKVFHNTIAAVSEYITSTQNHTAKRHISAPKPIPPSQIMTSS